MTGSPSDAAVVLGLAIVLDLALGEPSNRWHPVAWLGRGLGWIRRLVAHGTPVRLLALGAIVLLGSAVLVGGAALGLERWASGWGGALLQGWILKCAFSVRRLLGAAREVRAALVVGRLDEARRSLGRHLVSRPTEALSSEHVASATVESVAENLTDSVAAPLLFFLLFGLPGAWVYRVVNTADAMWGYRQGDLEYFGKAAARLDDLLNWGPARIAAVGIVIGALLAGESAASAWRTMRREHGWTRSPNAGWTMAAMAGALGVALEKPGAYRLGRGALPAAHTIDRAVRVVASASGLVVVASLAVAAVGG